MDDSKHPSPSEQMRRQARISKSGAHVVCTASALQVWLWLLIFVFQNEFRISRCIQPGYLDFDNLPETNFTCAGKVIGGYYADLETSCQMFHVCTVGQQEEPMDIKFLCLNGTVFDQETRVCERVDEVDCTKSEKFYSLNLELYGSTAPPIIQAESSNNQAQPTEQAQQQAKPSQEEDTDPATDELSTTSRDKAQATEAADSTEDPTQDVKKDEHNSNYRPHNDNVESAEYQDEDDIDEYDDDYTHSSTTVSQPPATSSTTTTNTPVPRAPSSSPPPAPTSPATVISTSHIISPPSPSLASIFAHSSLTPSVPPLPTLNPAFLSPQEFILAQRGAGNTEAISFQRQSGRPADGVYITHAPAHQYDHFQYESSRTAPRPINRPLSQPTPFVQRQPQPFRSTTLDPQQLLRPGPAEQPSEKYETLIKQQPQTYQQLPAPAQRPLPFNPYYYERKRSDDGEESSAPLAARSVPSPPVPSPSPTTERAVVKPKSPPRVIVTASASVSDSTGKRLNYTVGNVVSAVKPIVPINYDDYKESDLIFDPFFLDVPKLQKRRKSRSKEDSKIVSVPVKTGYEGGKETTPTPIRVLAIEKSSTPAVTTTSSTPTWNPDDYVDDNYEPQAYVPPSVILHDNSKPSKERQSVNEIVESKVKGAARTASSQSPRAAAHARTL